MDYLKQMQRAIDFVEDNLNQEFSLNDVAREAAMSQYHFLRMFKVLIGDTIGSYIRKRRLTLAAKKLTETDMRIIDIAFEYLFESQEAFTRSFKKQFRTTPAKYRINGINRIAFEKQELTKQSLEHILKGDITMEPKIVHKDSFKVVGMECRSKPNEDSIRIPELWQKFVARMQEIKHVINPTIAYEICECYPGFDINNFTEDTKFTNIACFEVDRFDDLPEGMVTRIIPAGKYAVFTHKGSVKNLKTTVDYIYGTWAANTKHELAGTNSFKLYDKRFNPENPEASEFDIYIPIK